jgi:hypothetical protein
MPIRFLFRRTPIGLALGAWRLWRRLPASQRRRLIQAARTHGPKLASAAMQRRRARRLP